MLQLRGEMNELGDFVTRLKDKLEKITAVDRTDTMSDSSRLNFEEFNDLTHGESHNQLHFHS